MVTPDAHLWANLASATANHATPAKLPPVWGGEHERAVAVVASPSALVEDAGAESVGGMFFFARRPWLLEAPAQELASCDLESQPRRSRSLAWGRRCKMGWPS